MKNWKEIVKGVAPTLATALGGPLAGMATKLITGGLTNGSSKDSDILESLMSPEGLAKLKEIEADFETEMKRLDVDVYALEVKDRDSARRLAIDTSLAPHAIITFVNTVGFFVVLWYLLFSGITLDESVKMAAAALLGVLGTNVTLSMKFWFGGSPQDSQNMQNIYNAIPREQLKK